MTVIELTAELRARAAEKRNDLARARPQNLSAAIASLHEVVESLRSIVAAQSAALEKRPPLKFTVTEREINGKPRSFTVE